MNEISSPPKDIPSGEKRDLSNSEGSIVLDKQPILEDKIKEQVSSSFKSKKAYIEDVDEIYDDQVNARQTKRKSSRLMALGLDDISPKK